MNNILLIGFMGTGKSTVSKKLMELTKMEEVDMDSYIVDREKMSISEIFSKCGEEHFRKIETECLKEIVKMDNVIVSCGGGIVVKDENVEYMKTGGKIVLLTAKPETIFNRVRYCKDRPILNGNMNIEFIESLMNKRKDRYLAVADIIISTDDKDVLQIANEIIEKIEG